MVREDDLRATFSALHAEEAPPRAVTAADLIQRGRSVRTRRRTIAVVGSGLATVGVVALALAVLPAATPPEPAIPGPSSTTSPVPSTTTPTSTPTTTPESTLTTVPPAVPPRSSTVVTSADGSEPVSTSSPPGTVPGTSTSTSEHPPSTTPPTSR
jgi:hypothetical protein